MKPAASPGGVFQDYVEFGCDEGVAGFWGESDAAFAWKRLAWYSDRVAVMNLFKNHISRASLALAQRAAARKGALSAMETPAP